MQLLHQQIATSVHDVVEEFNNPAYRLVNGELKCGKVDYQIAIFRDARRRSSTKSCQPDMALFEHGRPRLIIEIEEQARVPNYLFGKAIGIDRGRYISFPGQRSLVPLEHVVIVQCVNTQYLQARSRKRAQYRELEPDVPAYLKRSDYALLHGSVEDFRVGLPADRLRAIVLDVLQRRQVIFVGDTRRIVG